MDAWKLTDEELDGIVAALTNAKEGSKHGQRLLADLTASQTARRRRAEEDAEWDKQK